MEPERNASRKPAVEPRRPAQLRAPAASAAGGTHAGSTLQQRVGNGGTQLFAGPLIARQTAPPPAPSPPPPQIDLAQALPDPDATLIDEIADFLLQLPDVVEVLELPKAKVKKLKTSVERTNLGDADLDQRLKALDKNKRPKIAAAAIAQVQEVIKARRDAKVATVAGEIVVHVQGQLASLAEHARHAEEVEAEEFKSGAKKRGKRRPQFGVIRKYIHKDTIDRQIDAPQSKAYALREDYRKPLGLLEREVLFPGLYNDEGLVETLKSLPKEVRKQLKGEVDVRTFALLQDYVEARFDTTPAAVIAEWKKEFEQLDKNRVVENLEGKNLAGYVAVRMELLSKFGSHKHPQQTIQAINDYFQNELMQCTFLEGHDIKPGPGNTLVHKELNAALMRAEDFMKDPKRDWLGEVVANVKGKGRGYWATNIRENRNNPARPSEHTYGFAIDVVATSNPNLAKFKQADWDFVADMAGGRAIYDKGGAYTKGAEALRDPARSTEAQMLEAAKDIRSQSTNFAATFASESSLRARLHLIVAGTAAGQKKKQTEIDALLDLARNATNGNAKDRREAAKMLKSTLEADFFKQQAISSAPAGAPSKLRDILVKSLAPITRSLARITEAEATIRAQILAPADKVTTDARKHRLGVLFSRNIVKELSAVAAADRAELARQVLRDLRLPLVRKDTDNEAHALAALLRRGFEVLDQTVDRKGNKVGPGSGMGNIAARGFSDLSHKLVVALVHPRGGDLTWLGVQNQDMHHFQLRTWPTIKKATLPPIPPPTAPVPQPSAPPPPPSVAPQAPGIVDPWAPL